jgi:hypothetical protein
MRRSTPAAADIAPAAGARAPWCAVALPSASPWCPCRCSFPPRSISPPSRFRCHCFALVRWRSSPAAGSLPGCLEEFRSAPGQCSAPSTFSICPLPRFDFLSAVLTLGYFSVSASAAPAPTPVRRDLPRLRQRLDTGGKYSYAISDERVSKRQDGSGGPDRSGVGTESQQPAQQGQESRGGSPFAWRVRGNVNSASASAAGLGLRIRSCLLNRTTRTIDKHTPPPRPANSPASCGK